MRHVILLLLLTLLAAAGCSNSPSTRPTTMTPQYETSKPVISPADKTETARPTSPAK